MGDVLMYRQHSNIRRPLWSSYIEFMMESPYPKISILIFLESNVDGKGGNLEKIESL
jgi:hypothetical protein